MVKKNFMKGLRETVGACDVEVKSFSRIGKSSESPPNNQASVPRRPIVFTFKRI